MVQHGIKVLFGGSSCVQTSLSYIDPPFIKKAQKRAILVICLCAYMSLHIGMGLHMKEGVRVHDMHCGSKSY